MFYGCSLRHLLEWQLLWQRLDRLLQYRIDPMRAMHLFQLIAAIDRLRLSLYLRILHGLNAPSAQPQVPYLRRRVVTHLLAIAHAVHVSHQLRRYHLRRSARGGRAGTTRDSMPAASHRLGMKRRVVLLVLVLRLLLHRRLRVLSSHRLPSRRLLLLASRPMALRVARPSGRLSMAPARTLLLLRLLTPLRSLSTTLSLVLLAARVLSSIRRLPSVIDGRTASASALTLCTGLKRAFSRLKGLRLVLLRTRPLPKQLSRAHEPARRVGAICVVRRSHRRL